MTDANGHIGSNKLFENDKIVLWLFELKPGEETPLHTHERSYVWYALQGGSLDCEDEHGKDLGVFEIPTGSVFAIKYANGELEVTSEFNRGVKFPATHKAKNISDETYRELIVEYK